MATLMKAVQIKGGAGPADAMFVAEVERPEPALREILIRVAGAGVNRPDIAQREGNYPPPPGASPIMGLEVAGVVESVGADVTTWTVGDRVAALLPGGGYAEYATVDARHALPVPDSLSLAEAAVLPETVFTVFSNLFERGRLAAGETALIHGGNSGIGVTAILMARAAGARVFATVRGAEKAQRLQALGVDRAIDVGKDSFVDVVKAEGGADVVLDMIGGDYFAGNIAVLKTEGRLSQIATLGGNIVEANLFELMFKRLTLTASTLRGRTADEKARLTAAVLETAWPWFTEGTIRLPVDRKFALDEAPAAHRWLEDGQQFGKVILIP